MIDSNAIIEIITVYEKYGWVLRRILVTKALKKGLGSAANDLFGGVQITESDLNAAWFSRPPQPGGVAWEIRHLSETPYALLENIDEDSGEFEDSLRSVEARLREKALKTKSA